MASRILQCFLSLSFYDSVSLSIPFCIPLPCFWKIERRVCQVFFVFTATFSVGFLIFLVTLVVVEESFSLFSFYFLLLFSRLCFSVIRC